MSIKKVDATTAKKWLDEKDAVIIDVREPSEFASQKVSGAILYPLGTIHREDIPRTNKKVIIQCQKGGRSMKACQKLTAEDSELDVYNLVGGIEAWTAAGLPVEQGEKNVISLARQVQLTVGLGVLLFGLLAFFVNPGFVWGAMFFGAGLTFAGITDWCGLARLLAKMPWNN